MESKRRILAHKLLNKLANYIEFGIAMIILGVIAVLLVQFTWNNVITFVRYGILDFSTFLAYIINLIIGLEFTRMLCRHSPDTIIEVLMFATAKQIIVEHPTEWGTFFGVVAIAVLFIIRKYLLPAKSDQEDVQFSYISQIFRNRKKETHNDLDDDNSNSYLIEV